MLEYEGKILEEAGACVIIPHALNHRAFGKAASKISGREMIAEFVIDLQLQSDVIMFMWPLTIRGLRLW